MRLKGLIQRLIALLPLLAAARAAADGPYASATATTTWQDNITNAPAGDGIVGAFSFDAESGLTWIQSLDFSTFLFVGFDASADACPRFSGLDSLSFQPQLELRRKFGLGPQATVVSLGIEGGAIGFNDSERSRIEGSVSVGLSKRLSDSVQVLLEARLGTFDARDVVFTGNYASAGATLNWDVDDTWRVRLLAGWRSGDVVSNYLAEHSAQGWIPVDSEAFNNPGAWHYVPTFGAPYVAWRVDARTGYVGAGLSPAIGPHTSLQFQVVRYETKGYDRYIDDVASAAIVHRF
jgi:hypothetical protein